MRYLLVERRELMKVSRKETEGPNTRSDVSSKGGSARHGVERKTTHSEIAHASPKPSYVEVPLVRLSAHKTTNQTYGILTSSELIDDYQRVL